MFRYQIWNQNGNMKKNAHFAALFPWNLALITHNAPSSVNPSIVNMLGSRGLPSLQCFSNSKRALVNDTRIVKIYGWSNDHACFAMFDPLAHVLTFRHVPSCEFQNTGRFHLYNTIHNRHKVFYKPHWVDVQLMVWIWEKEIIVVKFLRAHLQLRRIRVSGS